MSLSQALIVPGISSSSTPSIASTKPTLDLDPEYGLGTTGARKLNASLKQGFQLASRIDPGTQDFWFAGWVKLGSVSGDHTLVVTGAGWSGSDGVWITVSSGKIKVLLNDSVNATRAIQTFDTTLITGEWYFVVVTFDRDGVCTAYVNGIAESSTLDITGQQATLGAEYPQPYIGSYANGALCIDGSISRLLYGEGTLPTEAEITEMYNRGQGLAYAELSSSLQAKVTHAWNCFEASDGTSHVPLYDAAGSNDGTEVGGELLTDGGLENWTSATDLTDWGENLGSGSSVNQSSDAYAGTYSARCNSTGSYVIIMQSALVPGTSYDWQFAAKSDGTDKRVRNPVTYADLFSVTTSWQQYSGTADVAYNANYTCSKYSDEASDTYFDACSVTSPYIPSTDGPRQATAEDSEGDNTGVLAGFSDTISPWVTDVPDAPNVAGGYALEFDGTDDQITLGTTPTFASGSLSVWVKPSALSGSTIGILDIAGSGANGLLLFSNSSGVVDFQVGNGSTVVNNIHSATLTVGEWTHIGATWDAANGDVKVSVNGSIETTTSGGIVSVDASGYQTRIGSHANVAGRFFNGLIDDVILSENVLSEAELTALYSGTDPTTALTNRYKLDDGPQGGTPQDGDPIATWQSRDGSRTMFVQPTATLRPTLSLDANSKRWLVYDGSDDYLKLSDALLSGTATTFFIVVDSIAQTGTHMLFATSDEAAATKYYAVAVVNDKIVVYQYDGSTLMTLTGTTALGGTAHVIGIRSDGTTTTCTLDGASEAWASGTDTGNTWGDAPDRDNVTLGALVHTSVTSPADASIARLLAYERQLTDAEVSAVATKLQHIYGI